MSLRLAPRRGLPLRWRLMLLVVVAVAPLLVFSLGYQYAEYQKAVATTNQRTLELARSMALLVDEELQGFIAAMETLAVSRALQEGDIGAFRAKAETVVAQQFPGGNILLLREDGQQVMNTILPPGAALPSRPIRDSTRRVFDTGRPGVSDLFQGSAVPRPIVAITVPVKDAAGQVNYVIQLNPSLDTFDELIRRQHLPNNWLASVFDRSGVSVARIPNGEQFVGHPATPEFLAVLQAEREGSVQNTSREGIPLLSVFSHAERFGWAVAIGVPRAELIGPALSAAMRTLAVGTIILAAALCLALYAARRIARPIDSLRRLAVATEGGAPIEPAPTGLPEIDEVAVALHNAEVERRRSREAELLLRDSIDNLPEGFALFDVEDRLVVCNDSYRQLFPGQSDRVEIGMTFEDMLRGGSPTGPGGQPNEDWIEARLRDHRDPGVAIEQQVGDGRWALVRNRPLANGGLAGLRIDITALKSAEQAFRDSEERFRRVVEAAPNAIVTVRIDGKIEIVNAQAERIFGYARDEMLGQPVEMLLPARYSAGHPRLRDMFFADPKARLMGVGRDLYAVRKDGGEFPVEVGLSPIQSDGEIRVLASIIDITERRQTEGQLRQAQKMEAIGNLTGGMAHDFNNLLGVIVGNLDLARERLGDDGDLHELVGEALEAAWRGADLTRRLLAFARRQPLRPARIEVNDLVSDTVRLLRRLLGEDIEVSLNLGAGIWPVVADPAQLESALANLANNARDAMPGGGRLIIETENRALDADYAETHADVSPGDYVMIEVSDTGTGMSPETMSQIFEPFFTTKEAGKGTGLGLSMVFGFMRQSGGHLNVYSELDEGTTFRLYLPRAASEAAVAQAPEDHVVQGGSGETVLVVEDNPAMRRIALRQLRELGYRTLECDRAAAALDLLQREPVDLLFTDIVMPGGLDGVELARMARERWPALKIVLTSGFPQARVDSNGEGFATMRLLSKPYHKEELAAALRAALDG